MSDTKYVLNFGGAVFFIWLIAVVIVLVKPASFPLWVIELSTIIMWVGLIPLIVIGIVLLVFVILAIIVSLS